MAPEIIVDRPSDHKSRMVKWGKKVENDEIEMKLSVFHLVRQQSEVFLHIWDLVDFIRNSVY